MVVPSSAPVRTARGFVAIQRLHRIPVAVVYVAPVGLLGRLGTDRLIAAAAAASRDRMRFLIETVPPFLMGWCYSLMPENAIVSMILLWVMRKTVMGTSIITTVTAAPTPARDNPEEAIWDSISGSGFSASV